METPDSFMPRVTDFLNEISNITKVMDGDLLFSSEYLHNLKTEAFRRMDNFFADQGLELIVVCALRHPVEAATSQAQQNVKQGGGRLANIFEKPRWFSGKKTLHSALEAVGKDRIIAIDFNSAKEIGIERFLLGLIGYGSAAEMIIPTRSNESLSMAAVYLGDAHNELSAQYPEIKRKRGYLFSIGGEKFRLPEAVENSVRAACAEEVAWIEENFAISLKEKLIIRENTNDVISQSAARDIVKNIFDLNSKKSK